MTPKFTIKISIKPSIGRLFSQTLIIQGCVQHRPKAEHVYSAKRHCFRPTGRRKDYQWTLSGFDNDISFQSQNKTDKAAFALNFLMRQAATTHKAHTDYLFEHSIDSLVFFFLKITLP